MTSGTHTYQILLKKGELEVELSSDDKGFITQEMNKWFERLLDKTVLPALANSAPSPVQSEPPQSEEAEESLEEAIEPAEIETAEEEPLPEVMTRQVLSPGPELNPDVVSKPVKDDFDEMIGSIMEDIESAPELPAEPEAAIETTAKISEEAPASQGVDLGMVDSLADLCEKSSGTTPRDFTLLAAYYLTYFEGESKFSLKRINSLLIKAGLSPVNHSVLEQILADALLEMVPDVTGMAEVTEYTITNQGQAVAERLL